jgi:hypothetical protein
MRSLYLALLVALEKLSAEYVAKEGAVTLGYCSSRDKCLAVVERIRSRRYAWERRPFSAGIDLLSSTTDVAYAQSRRTESATKLIRKGL